MRPEDPNLPYLILVADALGDLRDEMVFVGGCAAGLLVTDPIASEIRATRDVDAVVEATGWIEFKSWKTSFPNAALNPTRRAK